MGADEPHPADQNEGNTSERPHTSLLRGSIVIGIARVSQLAAGFLIGILVSRALGPAGKGELALLQQFPAVAALMLGFGVASASTYFVGRGEHSPAEAVSDSGSFALAVSAVGVPALVLLMRAFVPALAGVSTLLLWLAALSVPLSLLSSMLAGILTGQGRLTGLSVGQTTSTVLSFGLVSAAFALHWLTVGAVVTLSLISLGIGVVALVAATGVRRVQKPSVGRLRQEAQYARRSYVASIAGYLELRQDTLLLGILSSASAVGVYSVGVSFSELMWHLPQTVAAALTARAYQEDHVTGVALTTTITRLTTAMMLVVTVLLAIAIRPLVVAVFGPAFAPAAIVFMLLAPGIFVTGISNPLAAYLSTRGTLFPGVSSLSVMANLALNAVLIPRYSFYGAAIASTITYTVSALYIIGVFRRSSNVAVRDVVLPCAADLRLTHAALKLLFKRS